MSTKTLGRRTTGLFWKAADGTGEVELLLRASGRRLLTPTSWSGDGQRLAVHSLDSSGATGIDVGVISMEGEPAWHPLLAEWYMETEPAISPDGQWLAYYSWETLRPEVYVRPFPDVESGREQISGDSGEDPLWSPDGNQLSIALARR